MHATSNLRICNLIHYYVFLILGRSKYDIRIPASELPFLIGGHGFGATSANANPKRLFDDLNPSGITV